jgi:hypothetical protein
MRVAHAGGYAAEATAPSTPKAKVSTTNWTVPGGSTSKPSAANFGSSPYWLRTVGGVIILKSGADQRCVMRTLLCICSLSLIFVCGAALAEPEDEPVSPTPLATAPKKTVEPPARAEKSVAPNTPEQIRKRGADWLAQCLKDWDAATHMTKKDWQRVCRRVAGERINELITQIKK